VRFEEKHRARATTSVKVSNFVTRFDALDGWYMKLLAWISAWVPDRFKAKGFVDYMAPAPKLDFLPEPELVAAAA